MVTREFLLKNGFIRNFSSPECVEDYYMKEQIGGYMSVRFKPNIEEAVGLYAYSETEQHLNIRKVVLSDTKVTIRDYEIAKEICHI